MKKKTQTLVTDEQVEALRLKIIRSEAKHNQEMSERLDKLVKALDKSKKGK